MIFKTTSPNTNNDIIQSRIDTKNHISKVGENIDVFVEEMNQRKLVHDASKLEEPELSTFAIYGPRLKDMTYMSEEYNQCRKEMDVALKHHYENNSHHPEHYSNGVDGMNLMDLVEMFCDWKAASERHADGDLMESIRQNTKRFNLSPQLVNILNNTVVAFPLRSNK